MAARASGVALGKKVRMSPLLQARDEAGTESGTGGGGGTIGTAGVTTGTGTESGTGGGGGTIGTAGVMTGTWIATATEAGAMMLAGTVGLNEDGKDEGPERPSECGQGTKQW